MSSIRRDPAGRRRGRGRLADDGGNGVAGVDYDITVRKETLATATRDGVSKAPLFEVMRGTLTVVEGTPDFFHHHGRPFTLRLEDGSTAPINLEPGSGTASEVLRFTFRGQIEPPPGTGGSA